jgi:hypothetical protein
MAVDFFAEEREKPAERFLSGHPRCIAARAVSPQVFTGAKNVCVVFPQEKIL